jgi:hypothetical protein
VLLKLHFRSRWFGLRFTFIIGDKMRTIENHQATCLPPEAYIRLMQKLTQVEPPKFMRSVYPEKNHCQKKQNDYRYCFDLNQYDK